MNETENEFPKLISIRISKEKETSEMGGVDGEIKFHSVRGGELITIIQDEMRGGG